MGLDHGAVALLQLRVGIIELQDVHIAVTQLRHAQGALLGHAHPRPVALAPAQEPQSLLHLGGEADAVVGEDHVLFGQLVEGHVHGLGGLGAAGRHLHGDLEPVLGRIALGMVPLSISGHVGDLQDGLRLNLLQKVLVQLFRQGLGGVPRHRDHQVCSAGPGDVEGIELAFVGVGVFLAAAPAGLGTQHDAAVAGTVVGLDGLAVVSQGKIGHLGGAGDGLVRRGIVAVVDLIGGGIVHVVGLAAVDAHLRQSVALGSDHGGFQKLLGSVSAYLGHAYAQHVVLHAHGVHRLNGAAGHAEGDAAPIGAFLPAGGGQGEEVGPILGGQGRLFAGEQLAQLAVGHHHVRAGHGHGQGAAGDLGAVEVVGPRQGQGQGVPALRGEEHPHGAFLRSGDRGNGYEPRQQDQGDEDAEFLFHSSVYTIRRRKRE